MSLVDWEFVLDVLLSVVVYIFWVDIFSEFIFLKILKIFSGLVLNLFIINYILDFEESVIFIILF